ncbi:MAG: Bcr/CflA family efflux MFS transporter [Anaerovoracaceae bacterium]
MDEKKMLVEQPRLGRGGMMLIITAMNMVAPLSTDMYLPALPGMADYFHTSEGVMNLTMVGFFFFFAIGMLIFGPISDKYGRKKVLLSGVALYALASICCALSFDVNFLIVARAVQALGGGCMVAVSTAIVKDAFSAKAQAPVLATAQALGVIAPMLAPIIGAQILRFFIWRATFVVLTIIALVLLLMVILMKETLPQEKRLQGSVMESFSRMGKICRDRTFMLFLCATAVFNVSIMSYITTSSYIYVTGFGLKATTYSYFFAANALISVLGPVFSVRVRRVPAFIVMGVMLGVSAIGGVLLMIFGHASPFIFLACFSPTMAVGCCARPYSIGILLGMQNDDAGSASSLINFVNSMLGSLGMFIITAIWTDYVFGVGALLVAVAIAGTILCLLLAKLCGIHSIDRR